MTTTSLMEVARETVARALKAGAKQAAASARRSREVSVGWRDGKLEKLSEATSRAVGLSVYVDGRYCAVSSSDLRPEALQLLCEDAVAMARALEVDPHRRLPDPELYLGQAAVDLRLEDPGYDAVEPAERVRRVQAMEAAAREAPGAKAILSVTTEYSDDRTEIALVASNGFEGTKVGTSFWMSAEVTAQDADGRRPEESDYAGARHRADLPEAARVGRGAAERALSRLGAKKGSSGALRLALENRAAGRLVSALMGPLSAAALQQKQSMFEGKQGAVIGSALLDVADDPLVPKGFGSRLFDGEGIAARRRPVFEQGVLRNFYVDTYYGRKLGLAPTSGSSSNLAWKTGAKDLAGLLEEMKEGLLVTGFLGGNSNGTTGDFSLGIQGFFVRGGKVAEPFAEMNLSGNHLAFWKRLVAVGNDPYPYSSLRTPSLVFEGAQVAGV